MTNDPTAETEGSVTAWIRELRSGDDEAAQHLWDRYFQRMARVAASRVGATRRTFDAEDVALSAFNVFCQVVRDGRYAEISREAGLWKLLSVTTRRKATDRLKTENASRRGGSGRGGADDAIKRANTELDQLASGLSDPECVAMMAEECRRLLALLNDRELEQVALLKMEGYTNAEIATELHYSKRTIQRMLKVIKETWEHELAEDSATRQTAHHT